MRVDFKTFQILSVVNEKEKSPDNRNDQKINGWIRLGMI
jgi:hypothetical protein